jgi:UDP-glucose 4-epimerase
MRDDMENAAASPLAGTRALVIGGAGFVGSHLVDLLLDEGCARVVVVDDMVRGRPANLAAALATGRVDLVEEDIRDGALMRRLVEEDATVFHQAALRITHCAAEPDLAMEVMVKATHDLLQLCGRSKARKVVMASSASIYGMAEEFPTAESHHPYANRTLYGAAKACCGRSTTCTASTTSLCAISTSTGPAWTSTAATPR